MIGDVSQAPRVDRCAVGIFLQNQFLIWAFSLTSEPRLASWQRLGVRS